MQSGIYVILNSITGDCYIGSALNLNNRFLIHKARLKNNNHHSIILQSAYNKYGLDNFKYNILLYCEAKKLIFYEQRAINCYKPKYNICQIAGNSLGYKHSTEAKIKMSMSKVGKVGHKHSDETKAKMSASKLGCAPTHTQKHSEEAKTQMSIIKLGNQNHLGHRHSDETKKKISNSMKQSKELK